MAPPKKLKNSGAASSSQPRPQPDNANYPGLYVQLFEHQKLNITRMEDAEFTKQFTVKSPMREYTRAFLSPRNGLGEFAIKVHTTVGFLSDLPGYGKSYCVLGLILRDKMEWDLQQPHPYNITDQNDPEHCGSSFIERAMVNLPLFRASMTVMLPKLRTNLILCPSSCIAQWKTYLENTTLKHAVITKRDQANTIDVNDYDVVLVSCSFFNDLTARYPLFAWKRFIYDDPDNCHVANMRFVISAFTWILTPNSVGVDVSQTSWVYFYQKIVKQRFRLIIKNDDDFVRQSVVMSPVIYKSYKITNAVSNLVKAFADDAVADLVSAGDINGAIMRLGGSLADKEDIVTVLQNRMTKRYTRLCAEIEGRRTSGTGNPALLEKLENERIALSSKLQTLRDRFKEVMEEPCGICMDTMEKPTMMPCCLHMFCGECILHWLIKKVPASCPMCRTPCDPQSLILLQADGKPLVDSHNAPAVEKPKPKSKPEQALVLIKEAIERDGHIILVSFHDASFSILGRFLQEENIEYSEVAGTPETRAKVIQRYQSGELRIIFLNAKNSGAGVNLQNTTDIIMYHPVTRAEWRTQILGRALRLGRDPNLALTVHTLE